MVMFLVTNQGKLFMLANYKSLEYLLLLLPSSEVILSLKLITCLVVSVDHSSE